MGLLNVGEKEWSDRSLKLGSDSYFDRDYRCTFCSRHTVGVSQETYVLESQARTNVIRMVEGDSLFFYMGDLDTRRGEFEPRGRNS